MMNKMMKNNLKKSGFKTLCTIMVATTMMSTAVPAFAAESNEEAVICYQEEVPVVEDVEVVEDASAEEDVEVVEDASAEEDVEVVEDVPVEEDVEVVEDVPAEENVEVVEDVPAEENVEVVEDVPVEETDETEVPDETETVEETPAEPEETETVQNKPEVKKECAPAVDMGIVNTLLGYHGTQVDYEDLVPGKFYLMQIPAKSRQSWIPTFTYRIVKINGIHTNEGIIFDDVMLNYDKYDTDGNLLSRNRETQVNTNLLNTKPNHFYEITDDILVG